MLFGTSLASYAGDVRFAGRVLRFLSAGRIAGLLSGAASADDGFRDGAGLPVVFGTAGRYGGRSSKRVTGRAAVIENDVK